MRNSWLRFPGLLGAFVLVLALTTPAQAVDWSAYIDTNASTSRSAPAKTAKTSRAKTSKRSSKKVAGAKAKKSKSKVKARSKAKRRSRR